MLGIQKNLSRFVLVFLVATLLASIVVAWRVNATESQSHLSANTPGTTPVRDLAGSKRP